MTKRVIAALGVAACLSMVPGRVAPVEAQLRVAPLDLEQGHVALGLALRHLGNTGVFMMATAHPDDENNGLLVMLNRGLGYRTALATATRGNGGQNEIGPELFEALGVLRTEELHAIHRFDGAEQYFTRASDFGFSFSIEETFERWGRDAILGDYVRHIRAVRPDVIVGFLCGGQGGGQHHQAAARLTAATRSLRLRAWPHLHDYGTSADRARKLGGRLILALKPGPDIRLNRGEPRGKRIQQPGAGMLPLDFRQLGIAFNTDKRGGHVLVIGEAAHIDGHDGVP